ncbi:MAG: HNH endonuclease [Clostridia bacterium]|nr:HNH endonuclease [Clostridia bacterium]
MEAKLSKRLLNVFGCETDDEPDLRNELNSRLNNICKPCWELKYCPYGALVEEFPLPPLLVSEHREHIKYLKKCLEKNAMGEYFDIPLDDKRRKLFQEEVESDDESDFVHKLSKFEKEASCTEFGHLCPAYFVSEPFTETSFGRNRSRNIPHATIIRVARRDNNTCQVCGKILLDRDIEIDHIIPYSRGGTSDESNLRVTCLECNRKKGKKIEI